MERGNAVDYSKLQFFVRKYADISTAHITQEDRDKLHEWALEEVHGGSAPITVAEYQYGFFISVPPQNAFDDKEFIDSLGFSDDFVELIKLAGKQGADVVRLDADAFVSKVLPTFDWNQEKRP
jgi:hypothetical protein